MSQKNKRHKSKTPGTNLFSLTVFRKTKHIERPNTLFKIQFLVMNQLTDIVEPSPRQTKSNQLKSPTFGIFKIAESLS